MTTRKRTAEQDRQNGPTRTGLPEQAGQNGPARAGLPAQGNYIRQPGQDKKERTAEKDSHNRIAITG
jgi:hypothetical protein